MRIVFRGSKQEVVERARRLGAILSGDERDHHNIARGFMLALGFAALSDIKDAYITKARGGTDEMGVRWKPLSREYLAYGRRFGPGEQARLKKAAGLGRANNQRGLLTAQQNKRWRQIYGTRLARFLLSMPEQAAKARAAQIAWATLKKEGARTKLEVFGDRQVEILRDRGVLFNSLSPGVLSAFGPEATYSKPSGPGGEEQIFEIEPGTLAVGTNVEYAGKQNAERKILPEENDIPAVWWDRWLGVANKALQRGAELFFGSAA